MMPLLFFVLAGEFFFGGMLQAQDKQPPWKLEAHGPKGIVKYNLITGIGVGTGGVKVHYKPGTPEAAELTAENATLNDKTGDVVATGNVILRREGTVWKAERIEYNFLTKRIT